MKKVALIANFNIKDKADAAFAVADRIAAYCSEIVIPMVYKEKIFRALKHRPEFVYEEPDDLYSKIELVIVIGGDGSMLEAARKACLVDVPDRKSVV